MTPVKAGLIGALTTLGCLLVFAGFSVHALRREPQMALSALASLVRMLALASGFKSVLVSRGSALVVVPFDDIARAIEKRDLLTHNPVHVKRASQTPEEGYDGRA